MSKICATHSAPRSSAPRSSILQKSSKVQYEAVGLLLQCTWAAAAEVQQERLQARVQLLLFLGSRIAEKLTCARCTVLQPQYDLLLCHIVIITH